MNWGEAMRRLSRVPEPQREKIVYQMSVQAALECDVRFEGWAHRNQLPPRGSTKIRSAAKKEHDTSTMQKARSHRDRFMRMPSAEPGTDGSR